MADLASIIAKINDLEVSGDAAVATALFTKLGQSINGLIDGQPFQNTVDFTVDTRFVTKADTWVVPANVQVVLVEVIGGGGAGGEGGDSRGGTGGNAALRRFQPHLVTPAATISIQTGAGGAGSVQPGSGQNDGGAGGISFFDTVTSIGGVGGHSGTNTRTAWGSYEDGSALIADPQPQIFYQTMYVGGRGGCDLGGDTWLPHPGGRSEQYAGGAHGSDGARFFGGGGGGSSYFGPGGAGGAPAASVANPGGSAVITDYGAGGGGAGAAPGDDDKGGDGAPGLVRVWY